MVSVGTRFVTRNVLCSGTENCREKNPKMEPGIIYEVKAKVDKKFNPNDVNKIYEVIKAVRSKYPGTIINYIELGSDGQTVTVQMFDVPGWQLIPVLLLILATLVVAYKILNLLVTFLKSTTPSDEEEKKKFWRAVEAMMWGVAIALPIGAGAYLIGKIKEG